MPHEELLIETVGIVVSVYRGGTGDPLVVFPRDTGRPGWSQFHEALASRFTVYAPALPGYDHTQRPEWMRDVRQMSGVMESVLDALSLERIPAVGLGFGGWIAAEMAVNCGHRFSSLILQSPMGVQPPSGEILDQFLFFAHDYVRRGFADPAAFVALYGEQPTDAQEEIWDLNREMTTRIAWKPYMFDQSLPHLLPALRVPTMVIACGEDQIVPRSCADLYAERIPGSTITVLERAGHQVDLEDGIGLADRVTGFVAMPAGRR